MSLQVIYEGFLATPSPAALARDVSLNYITTTTTVTGADEILKHLASQQRIVKKKSDKILSAIETPNALVLDVETTLEFFAGGGAYLPSLDDNFLTDRVVTFPIVHIVRFDSQNLVQHIRLYWDQGSLLKQVDVIGARGRNWPIRDAKDQAKLITNSVAGHGVLTPPQPMVPVTAEEEGRPFSPSKRYVKDPHTSLSLFAAAADQDQAPPVIAPRAAASGKRAAHEYNELFVGDGENEATPTKPKDRAIAPKFGAGKNYGPSRVFDVDEDSETLQSPMQPKIGSSKNFQANRIFEEQSGDAAIQPKAGSSKHYQAMRLFDDDETVAAEEPKRLYKTHPNKYGHFALGEENDGSQEIKDIPTRPARPMSQWDFADFATPLKPGNKIRGQDVRHFGLSDNEDEAAQTPLARPRVIQPRRDAETHFQLIDDGPETGEHEVKRVTGVAHNKGLGLYENNVYDEDGKPTPLETTAKQPLGILPNGAHRKKDFDSHWAMSDASPPDEAEEEEEHRPMSRDRVKAVRQMEASWDMYDQSPDSKKDAPPVVTAQKRSSHHTLQPHWGFGDDA